MQNTVEAQVNGVTTFICVSCRDKDDWYVSGPTVGKGKKRHAAILADHLPTKEAADKECWRIAKCGFNGPLE